MPKLPTWLSEKACEKRQAELQELASEVQLLRCLAGITDYEVADKALDAIKGKVNQFGAVLYPGKRRRSPL